MSGTEDTVAFGGAAAGPALVGEGLVMPIWRRVSLVGRQDPNTKALPDIDLTGLDERRAVSRKHARLDYRQAVMRVCDLGSTNGTYLNGERLPGRIEHDLAPGDILRFGGVELTYELDAPWPPDLTAEWEASTLRLSPGDAAAPGGRAGDPEASQRRTLATVMFTDIADSTRSAARLGDRAWRELLSTHHDVVRSELDRFDGREVRTTGDGFLATFASPATAVRCGCAVIDEVRRLGISVRVGLHTGEVELSGDGVQGIAVHIAARVADKADAGELLVSATVRDLVAGSGIQFADRGYRQLKGVPGKWRLYAVQAPDGGPA